MIRNLILINEPLAEMAVGKNTNLAYILSCLALGFDAYIYNLPEKSTNFFPQKISVILLKKNDKIILQLLKAYQEINQKIADKIEITENLKVKDFISDFDKVEISLSEINLVIQRLEPMKAPFPPQGDQNFSEILKQLKTAFPHLIFNCPIGLGDKEAVQKVNAILSRLDDQPIAIPTTEFRIADSDFTKQLRESFIKYREFFPQNKHPKIVLKPKNSAQSYGVFAIEESELGFDLAALNNIEIATLFSSQIYKIQKDLGTDELRKIIEILLCVQRLKTSAALFENYKNQKFGDVLREKIQEMALELYNEEILAQPFLEGVKLGDVRSIFLKNAAQKFYLAGHVYRKNIREVANQNFTTSYSGGAAKAASILELTAQEQRNLEISCMKLLIILNGELRGEYRNSIELGADFILVGDYENLLLGEINHTCPALIPIAEAMAKEAVKYEGGLFYTKQAILDVLAMNDASKTR